jgi:hypothetical protein
MATLNRTAVVLNPKQPFQDWLYTADPTSQELTLLDLVREPTIYLIPECDSGVEVDQALREVCEEIFTEQLTGWFNDETTWPQDRGFEVFCHWLLRTDSPATAPSTRLFHLSSSTPCAASPARAASG